MIYNTAAWFKEQTFTSWSSENWDFKVKASWVSCVAWVHSRVCGALSHVVSSPRGRGNEFRGDVYKGTSPRHESTSLVSSSRAPSPKTIPLGVRVSTYQFQREEHLAHKRCFCTWVVITRAIGQLTGVWTRVYGKEIHLSLNFFWR